MFNKVGTFLKEVKQELSKVSWPKKEELWSSTLIVIVVSVLLSGVIWVMDLIFSEIFMAMFK